MQINQNGNDNRKKNRKPRTISSWLRTEIYCNFNWDWQLQKSLKTMVPTLNQYHRYDNGRSEWKIDLAIRSCMQCLVSKPPIQIAIRSLLLDVLPFEIPILTRKSIWTLLMWISHKIVNSEKSMSALLFSRQFINFHNIWPTRIIDKYLRGFTINYNRFQIKCLQRSTSTNVDELH